MYSIGTVGCSRSETALLTRVHVTMLFPSRMETKNLESVDYLGI